MLWVGQKASTGAASPSTSAVLLREFQALKKKKKTFGMRAETNVLKLSVKEYVGKQCCSLTKTGRF